MKTYVYTLIDGTTDKIEAERYELERTEYVFYVGDKVVKRIPALWVEKLEEVK